MPIDRDKVLQTAQKLVERKRYDKAIAEYQKIVAEDPKDARTLLKIGDLQYRLEQYAEAILTYEGIAQHYAQQGFSLKAIAVYKNIRDIIQKHVPHLEERFAHVPHRLAELYAQLGLTSDALSAYDEIAQRLQRAGRDRDALEVIRKLVELDPGNPLPHLRLGEAFVRMRDVESAITSFGAGAEILVRLGRRDDALKVLERLLHHRPDPRFARKAAEIYLERAQPNDAMAALTKLQICFQANRKDLEMLALLARAFDALGQGAKAIEVQKEAARIALEQNHPEVFRGIVDRLLLRAPHDEAVRNFARTMAELDEPPPPSDADIALRESTVPLADLALDEEVEDDPGLGVYGEGVESARPMPLRSVRPPAFESERTTATNEVVTPAERRRLLVQVDELRRERNLEGAIDLVRAAVLRAPGDRELREKLCDLLIEVGDQEAATAEMLAGARVHAELGDVEGAVRLVDEVLLLEPDHPAALEYLRELGYQLPPEGRAADAAISVRGSDLEAALRDATSERPESLASYDFEEVEEVSASDIHVSVEAPPIPPRPPRPAPPAARAPQPVAEDDRDEEITDVRRAPQTPAPAEEPRPSTAPQSGAIEEALEEAEFFMSRGLLDDARAAIEELLERAPKHPLLLERIREIEAIAGGARAGPPGELPGAPPSREDRSFDIAASLDDALDALESPSKKGVAEVDRMLEHLKVGLKEQVPDTDASTHYDLGFLYKEMGKLRDAIEEFEIAARDAARAVVCRSMIGLIRMELGEVDLAIESFEGALRVPGIRREEELNIYYELASAHETKKSPDEAVGYLERVIELDPAFRDAADRLRRIRSGRSGVRSVAQDTPSEDLDAVFDELLGGGKLP